MVRGTARLVESTDVVIAALNYFRFLVLRDVPQSVTDVADVTGTVPGGVVTEVTGVRGVTGVTGVGPATSRRWGDVVLGPLSVAADSILRDLPASGTSLIEDIIGGGTSGDEDPEAVAVRMVRGRVAVVQMLVARVLELL